jgi:hypothetical protein
MKINVILITIPKPMHTHPKKNLIITGLKFHTNELDHNEMSLKQIPNSKESEYWFNQPSISNRYTILLDEESED